MTAKKPKRPSFEEILGFDDFGMLDDEVPELRSIARKLPKMFKEQRQRYLKFFYEVGESVMDEIDDCVQRHGTSQRSQAIARLARQSGLSPITLKDCIRVVRRYSTEEYASLIESPAIGWDHILQLSEIESPNERARWVERIVHEGLSPRQFSAKLRGDRGHRRPAPPFWGATPRKVGEALGRLLKESDRYLDGLQRRYFGDCFDIVSAIMNLPPDKVTSEMGDEATRSAELLLAIAAQATAAAEQLGGSRSYIEKVLALRLDTFKQENA